MSIEYASWISLFLYLFLGTCSFGNGAREISKEFTVRGLHHHEMNALKNPTNDGTSEDTKVLRLHSMDGSIHHGHVHHPSSHMDHMDPSVIVFFFINDLKAGNTMPVYFPKRNPASSPHFLAREQADSFPFALEELTNLLQLFSFLPGSPQAIAMEDTLRQCKIKPIKGETKFCATSLESMLDFVHGIFGLETKVEALSTKHLTESTTLLQNYTVLEDPEEIPAPKMVACHTMPYPYAIFYCHYQESESKVFRVLLGGENGDRAEAIAVCHMDTSHWSPSHVSFRVLGVQPGSSPICHFFPADHIVWVAVSSLIQLRSSGEASEILSI